MKIVVASQNQNKIKELRTLLQQSFADVELLSLADIGVTEDIVEDGNTFEENALIKARVAAKSGMIGVADDSGLTVDALDGAPGIYSARYAARCGYGNEHDDEENNRALLYNLRDVKDEDRGAAYVCAIACVLPDGREFTVRGEVRGRLLHEKIGDGGFGYDPLFFYEPYGKSFAQITAEEKHLVSHRGRAIRLFVQRLEELISK